MPFTKFGILKEMTAQRIWCYEKKADITSVVERLVPGGPSDRSWIGTYSHQSTILWQEATKDPKVLAEYERKAEEFREGQACQAVKAR